MPHGVELPPGQHGELLAACIGGEPCRAAARRLGIKRGTADYWWRAFRTRFPRLAGGAAQPDQPDTPSAAEVDAWTLRFLAKAGEGLFSLAGLAGSSTFQTKLDGDGYAAAVRSLAEAATAVASVYQRTRPVGPGSDLESPAAAEDVPAGA